VTPEAIANTSHNSILLSNISDDMSDDLLTLYIDNITELDDEYTITRRSGHGEVVVTFKDNVKLPDNGLCVCVSVCVSVCAPHINDTKHGWLNKF